MPSPLRPQDLVVLYQGCEGVLSVAGVLRGVRDAPQLLPILAKLESEENHLNVYRKLVSTSVDLDETERGRYQVNPNFHEKLKALDNERKAILRKMNSLAETVFHLKKKNSFIVLSFYL